MQPEGSDILFIHDTTELDYTTKKQMDGTGPLAKAGKNTRQGFFMHSHYVVSEEGLPLGTYGAKVYARDNHSSGVRTNPYDPIEDKESVRWLEGYRQPAAEILVRANRDRRLLDVKTGEVQYEKLYEKVRQGNRLGTIEFELKSASPKREKGFKQSPPRKARIVRQELRVSQLRLHPPYRKEHKLKPLTIWVVLADEIDPPDGEKPIRWILNTSAPIETLQQACKLVKLYTRRWQIEVFLRVLKTGCRVEEIQLKSQHAVFNALMLYTVIAWRIHYLVHLGRECPQLPCSVLFEAHEWRAAIAVSRYQQNRKAKSTNPVSIPAKEEEEEPSLGDMLLIVAKLGGYLARKNDHPPGAQCLWQGMDAVFH